MATPAKPKFIKDIEIDLVPLVPLIGKAHASLSNYNGALSHLINPKILLSPMTVKESTMSSRIEGTRATFTEVLQHEAGENFGNYKNQDIRVSESQVVPRIRHQNESPAYQPDHV